MAKIKADAFWKTKEGKRIRNYGGWLIGTGIVQIILALLALIIVDITFSLYYAFLVARAVYFIDRGVFIRMNKLKPRQLSVVCRITIATVVIETIFIYVLRDYSYSGQLSNFLPFLDIVILSDSVKCLLKWLRPYIESYGGNKSQGNNLHGIRKKEQLSTIRLAAKAKKTVEKKKASKEEEQRVHRKIGMIIYYSVAAVVILINIGLVLDNSITRTEIVESEEPIYFGTEYEDDSGLELGTEKIKQAGENGLKRIYTEEKKKLITGILLNSDIANVETVKEPIKEIIRRGTRKWQYMICSDDSYRYYSDEQFKDPKVGFTHASEDNCAKNNQGSMLALADTPPPANSYTSDGRLSESYVRMMEIIAERERELRDSEINNTSSTEPFTDSTTDSDPFAEERARQEAEKQARAMAESNCRSQADNARESTRRQLGAMGIGGSQLTTVPQDAYNSAYSSCMRSYGY